MPTGLGIEENKELVRSFYARVINERDLDAIDELLAGGFVHNGEARGRGGQKVAVEAFLAGFSDLHNEIELILAEGELVAAHQTWTGTHDGSFMGIEATGRRVSFPSTAVLTVRGGEIVEAVDVVGVAELMAELGADA